MRKERLVDNCPVSLYNDKNMKRTKVMVRKIMKIIVIVLLVISAAAGIAFGCFCYQNLHWWEKDMKKITKLGAVEKQVTLPSGNVVNYGELPGEGPALLLIHGQMGAWEDYASVKP